MYKIIRSQERYHYDAGWLSTYWHFSFDHYYDPTNLGFGPLRVFNDDIVQPSSGFPTHAHREMEIITYVLEGELEHKDSTGGVGRIRPGEVQRMTAGRGIRHSEYNPSEDEPVHLLQMWITPAESGLEPSYEQKRFSQEDRAGRLLPVASGTADGEALKIHQDATLYVSNVRPGDQLRHALTDKRRAYLFVIDGELQVNGEHTLGRGDQARIEHETELELSAKQPTEIVLINLP